MKTAENKSSTTATLQKKQEQAPFFKKEGQDGFFSQAAQNTNFFFNPASSSVGQTAVQPKLKIGKPNDKYEKEADSVADSVVQRLSENRSTDISSSETGGGTQVIQRKCAACEEKERIQKKEDQEENISPLEGKGIQRKPIFESNEDTSSEGLGIQRKCADCGTALHGTENEKLQKKESKSEGGENIGTPALQNQLNASKGKGTSLPENTRTNMESAIGADFSNVSIHTNSNAVQMNKDLGAKAFTHGSDIYFNQGQYDTNSSTGQHLLAHELTHTVQQGGADIKRNCSETSVTNEENVAVYDALSGWTNSNDSTIILNSFRGKSRTACDNIIRCVAQEAVMTRKNVLQWLHDDMVTADWNTLFEHFLNIRVYGIEWLVAKQINNLLSGYTSDKDSQKLLNLFQTSSAYTAEVLSNLRNITFSESNESLADWLFSDLTRRHAETLATQFLDSGNLAVIGYATYFKAKKIKDLIAGYTSVFDSADIVANFERIPAQFLDQVLYKLDGMCRETWGQTAGEALMEDMQYDDYEKLREMMPTLPVYNIEKNFFEGAWDKITIGFDYISAILQYAVCGLGGVIGGIISIVADIVIMVKDLAVAIKDIVGLIVYYLSDGAFGRENKDNVFNFFSAIGQFFEAPGDAISMMWNELTEEAALIEGPLRACQQAYFWVSRITNLIVNIILVAAGGYGAVKLVLKGINSMIMLARSGQLIAALTRLPGRLAKAVKGLPTTVVNSFINGFKAAIQAITKPLEIIVKARNTLSNIRMAAQDEGFFQFLRKQANSGLQRTIEQERAFWKEQKDFWGKKADDIEAGLNAQEKRLVTAVENSVDDLKNAEKTAREVGEDAIVSQKKSDDLLDEIKNGQSDKVKEGTKKEDKLPERIDSGVKKGWHPEITHEVELDKIKFSQSQASQVLGDGKTTVEDLSKILKDKGWDYTKEPPTMVKMRNGDIVSLDHRRIVAAKLAGNIDKIPIKLIDGATEISQELAKLRNFTVSSKAKLTTRTEIGKLFGLEEPVSKGYVAKNYFEAVVLRSARQKPEIPLQGTSKLPILK